MNENHLYTIERNWAIASFMADFYLEAMKDIDFATHMKEYQASLGSRPSDGDGPGYEVDSNGIANFNIEGPITKKMSSMQSMFGGTSSIMTARAFDRAASDPMVKGAFVTFDTPGGAINGLTTAEASMARFRKKKPMVGYVDDLCASAGYWLASQCDALYGDITSISGHIGVYQSITDSSDRMSKEGIKRIIVKSAPGKGAGAPGTEVTAEQIADIQREVDAFHGMFEAAIVRGRGMKADKVSSVSDGRGYIGEEAVKAGLINGIKDQPGAYKALLKLIEDRKNPSSKENKGTMPDEKDGEQESFFAHVRSFFMGDSKPKEITAAFVGNDISKDPKFIALEQQTKALQDQLQVRLTAEATMAADRNTETMEAYASEGKFTAANLADESESRASNPTLYDKLWKTRPVLAEFAKETQRTTVDASKLADEYLKTNDSNTALDDRIKSKVRASVGKKESK